MKPEGGNLKPEIKKAALGEWKGMGQKPAVRKVTEGCFLFLCVMKTMLESCPPSPVSSPPGEDFTVVQHWFSNVVGANPT